MDRRIEVVLQKIETDPGSCQLTLLADMVNLSLSRFRHLFKQETGTTPGQYLKTVRLEGAAFLLRTTFLSIKEIINQLGLSSNTHFVRDFKKIYGMSPTVYRNAKRPRKNRTRSRT